MDEKRRSIPLKRDSQSLGWLSESAVQPKKRKEIEGVGAASLIALQAQVAKTQQEASLLKEGKLDPEELRERRKGKVAALLKGTNKGVAQRNEGDKKAVKASSASGRLDESRAALERKAELYDRLASGQMIDGDEKYEVDFLSKGTRDSYDDRFQQQWQAHEYPPPLPQKQQQGNDYYAVDTADLATNGGIGGLVSGDMAMERDRRAWEAEVGGNLVEEAAREAAREAKIEAVQLIERETQAGRQAAEAARHQRAETEAKKRERLKKEFLRKQVEKLKAAKQQKS